MSVGYQGKTTNLRREIVATQAAAEQESKMGEMPGEIISFNPQNQTATIKPLYKPKANGTEIEMPELLEVPVRFTRAGKGSITFPISVGDKVNLRPQMRSSENYHDGGEFSTSGSRSFHLSDMEAYLDGGESLSDPIGNFDPENVHMRFSESGDFGIRGSSDGKIAIEGSEGNVYKLLAEAIRLIGGDGLNILSGSSIGNGIHEMQNKSQLLAIADKLDAMAL
jgi:hypothetical protein